MKSNWLDLNDFLATRASSLRPEISTFGPLGEYDSYNPLADYNASTGSAATSTGDTGYKSWIGSKVLNGMTPEQYIASLNEKAGLGPNNLTGNDRGGFAWDPTNNRVMQRDFEDEFDPDKMMMYALLAAGTAGIGSWAGGAGAAGGAGGAGGADVPWGVNAAADTGATMPYGDAIEGLIDLTNQGLTGEQAIAALGEINPAWTQTGLEFLMNNPSQIGSTGLNAIKKLLGGDGGDASGGGLNLGNIWSVLGPLLSGGASAYGSNKAAEIQANSAREALDFSKGIYSETKGNLKPFLDAGRTGGANLNYLLGINPGGTTESSGEIGDNIGMGKGSLLKPFDLTDFQESPAYKFNLAQGRQAIEKAANARGKYYAPATLQEISKFSQGLASNEFQNAFSNYNTSRGNIYTRLSNLAGSGQNAAVQQGGFGQNLSNSAGENITGAGNAKAAGVVGVTNAVGGTANDIYNKYLTDEILRGYQRPTYG